VSTEAHRSGNASDWLTVVQRWARNPQIEGCLTIAWGKKRGKWDKAVKESGEHAVAEQAASGLRETLSKAVEYLVAAEGALRDMTGEGQGNATAAKTVYVTLSGLPLTITLAWPFHPSTSGADFWVLHGDVEVAGAEGRHAPVSVNLSATVREVMPSLEPKDALGPVVNALRKEVDSRQIELVKSGKLVPVNFSSRHYDFKRGQWVFGKASDETIATFLERKIFWQTRLVGGDVWLGDGTDAQYLRTTTDHLAGVANGLAGRGLIRLERWYATALPALMARAAEFKAAAETALAELEKKHAFERG